MSEEEMHTFAGVVVLGVSLEMICPGGCADGLVL